MTTLSKVSDLSVLVAAMGCLAACGAEPAGPDDGADPGANEVYVADTLSKTVAIISLATMQITETVPVSGTPMSLAVSSDGETLYVGIRSPDGLGIISVADRSVRATVQAGGWGLGLVAHPTRSEVYRVNQLQGSLTIFDTERPGIRAAVPIGASPQYITLNPSGTHVLAALLRDKAVANVNVSTLQAGVIQVPPAPPNPGGPTGIAMADNDSFYLSRWSPVGADVPVQRVGYPSGSAIAERTVSNIPVQIAAAPGAAHVVLSGLTRADDGGALVLDAASLAVLSTMGPRGLGVAMSADGRLAAFSGEGRASAFEVAIYALPDSLLGQVPILGYPIAVAFGR